MIFYVGSLSVIGMGTQGRLDETEVGIVSISSVSKFHSTKMDHLSHWIGLLECILVNLTNGYSHRHGALPLDTHHVEK